MYMCIYIYIYICIHACPVRAGRLRAAEGLPAAPPATHAQAIPTIWILDRILPKTHTYIIASI